jgi:hypothetical protein
VTGDTPVVDVQNSTRVQRVLSDEVLTALPASRGYGNLRTTVSGIQANGTQNGGVNPGMISISCFFRLGSMSHAVIPPGQEAFPHRQRRRCQRRPDSPPSPAGQSC